MQSSWFLRHANATAFVMFAIPVEIEPDRKSELTYLRLAGICTVSIVPTWVA